MAAEYQVMVKTPDGNNLAVLDRYFSLEIQRAVNAEGFLNIAFPFGAYPDDYFSQDNIIEVWRQTDGGQPYLEGDTLFFQKDWIKKQTVDGIKTIQVLALDPLTILAHTIVAYNANSAQATKSGPADNLIKAIIRENLGSLATDTARSLAGFLSIQPDASLSPSTSKAFSRRKVLDVIKELAADSYTKGAYLAFDIVSTYPPVGVALDFRTFPKWRGVDRRWPGGLAPVVFDPENGSITEYVLEDDSRGTSNVIYAGGQGQEDTRIIKTAIDTAGVAVGPYSRREEWVDARNATDPDEIQAEADYTLRARRNHRTLSARITETPAIRYGRDFRYGDYVTASIDGVAIDTRIDAVNIRVEGGVETLNIFLRTD